ncbi:MAG: holo-ACP synthase [Pseudomonadota bacterium]
MILGLGTDLIDSRRIEKMMTDYPARFLEKYFTSEEIKEYEVRENAGTHILYLAKRFAAKEAFAKALGTGFQDGLYMKDLQILNKEQGKPVIECLNGALEKLEKFAHGCKGCKIHLSLTDEPPYAQATVIIEGI